MPAAPAVLARRAAEPGEARALVRAEALAVVVAVVLAVEQLAADAPVAGLALARPRPDVATGRLDAALPAASAIPLHRRVGVVAVGAAHREVEPLRALVAPIARRAEEAVAPLRPAAARARAAASRARAAARVEAAALAACLRERSGGLWDVYFSGFAH